MAAVNEEIISSMFKSNFSNLKSFAEMLNAEFTEEGHDEANRDKYKEDVARILNKFGACESNFQKKLRCLTQTKNEVHGTIAAEGEDCDRQTLMKDIDDIVNIIEGKSKFADEEPVLDINTGENYDTRVYAWIEKVEDILNEYNPLRFRDDDEEDDDEAEQHEREEQKISNVLENLQKKVMNKLEQSMIADDEHVMEVDEETSEEEEEDVESEEATQRTKANNEREKKDMDSKLKQLWKNYEHKISSIKLQDLDKIYSEKINQTMEVPFENLTHFPKFNKSILELFSREAIVVCGERQNYVDPISKMQIRVPVRNKKCGHIYDKETIQGVLRRKKDISCPCLGCSCRTFSMADLEEDEDLTEKVTQSLNRDASTSRQSMGDSMSNAEYLDSDNDSE